MDARREMVKVEQRAAREATKHLVSTVPAMKPGQAAKTEKYKHPYN